jgi:hypothetical protein
VIVLAVIGVLAIIAGILYVAGAANSIHFMVGNVHHGHHQIRAIVSFVIGIACLIGAYIAWKRPAGRSASASAGTGGGAAASASGSAGGSTGADASTGAEASGSTGPGETGSASPSGS